MAPTQSEFVGLCQETTTAKSLDLLQPERLLALLQ